MNLYQPTITGSLSVSGSVNISGSISIASGGTISGTASIATTALTASFVANAQTASYVLNAVSSSFALTASSADNLLVRNTLTAQTLVVQTITSSVDFVTGSTRFGSIAANTHVFTGSMSVSGSGTFTGNIGIGTSPSFPFDLLTSSTGSFNTIAQIFNNDFTTGNRSYLRVRQQVSAGGSVSSYFGAGQDSNLYIIANNSARGGDLIIDGANGAATFVSSVGINGVSPTYPLYVRTGTNQRARFVDNGGLFQMAVLNDAENTYSDMSLGNSAVVIKSGGNVGIGTSSPLSNLQINGNNTTAYDPTVDSGQDDAGVTTTIRNNDISTVGSFSQINMMVSGDSGRALGRIVTIRMASATSDMAFVTENANTKAERMRITAAGRVGIENSAPQGKLEVGRTASNTTAGGHFFSTFIVPVNTWTTVFYAPNNNWAAITEFTWTSGADYNRSGAAYMRWAYNGSSASLGVVYTLFNNDQNAPASFRNSGGEIQIYITGGATSYYVQVRIQGSQAA